MENESILKEWFERVDSEKTGSITATQLKNALSVGNLEFTISFVQQMIRMYDFDRNGTMSFKEFVALNRFLLQVQQAFSDLERDRGFLVPDDVYEALLKIGFSLDYPAFYTVCESQVDEYTVSFFDLYKDLRSDAAYCTESLYCSCFMLLKSFDQKKNGRFLLDDFISLCIFVHSARNLFNSFDTSKQGSVTLELNQFIYCTANCRI